MSAGMKPRPVRSQIYLPVVKWGVNDADWKFVYVTALVGYAVPFALGLDVHGFPLAIPSGPAAFVGALLFFNWTRRGRRPHWLQHTLASRSAPSRQHRRAPADRYARPVRPWIKQEGG
jgi:hypothetical protein